MHVFVMYDEYVFTHVYTFYTHFVFRKYAYIFMHICMNGRI